VLNENDTTHGTADIGLGSQLPVPVSCKPVAVCGEMAGDARYAPLLLALGLGEFSLHPNTLLELRRAIRNCDLSALRARAPALLRARTRKGIEDWLRNGHAQ